MQKFLCLYGDTSRRKLWCNFANRLWRYKPKYTKFVANFRTLIAKKLLRTDPSSKRYALASVRHPVPLVKFLGATPLSPWNMSIQKVDFGYVKTTLLFFAFCVPKLTEFGRNVHEWSSFGRVSIDVILFSSGDIRDPVEVIRNRAEVLMFWAAKFLRGGIPKFLTQF